MQSPNPHTQNSLRIITKKYDMLENRSKNRDRAFHDFWKEKSALREIRDNGVNKFPIK